MFAYLTYTHISYMTLKFLRLPTPINIKMVIGFLFLLVNYQLYCGITMLKE